MKIKKSFFLTALLLCSVLLCSCKKDAQKLMVYSQDEKPAIELERGFNASEKMAYFDIAIDQSSTLLADKLDCSKENAQNKIWSGDYKIYTFYDNSVQLSLVQSCNLYKNKFDCSAAITDLSGNLVAAYSNSINKENTNYATKTAQPHSSIKPLAVYMQALEQGKINWSTTYKDSAYKQLENADGSKRNWPKNAGGGYSNKNITVYEALRKSLNTVAVKCLNDVGVNNSIDFLQKNFGIPMFYEQYSSKIYGEDEIIGNVALGYLNEGISVVDMAGYYQIFATGGQYEKPNAIYKICDKDGNEIYKREYSPKSIVSPQTADIMNKMLQGVTNPGATGEAAYCEDIETAGKTGTADANTESWFVGTTPEYSCAVWHGKNDKNIAPEIFSKVIKDVYQRKTNLKKEFDSHSSLKHIFYCEESGMMVSSKCRFVQEGYYSHDTKIDVCNIH